MRIDAGEPREIGQAHARAHRDRRPAFDAEMIEPVPVRGSASDRRATAAAACRPVRRPRVATTPRAASSQTGTCFETKYDGNVRRPPLRAGRGTSIDV